jgi:NAD(P)-dependent dehydrogenase (short-subunit alcohol dehydrogenase family)
MKGTTMTPTLPLDGRVALVTGVSRRIAIGAAVARRLAADGAAVVLHSWSPHDAEQPWGADSGGPEAVLAEIRDAGGRAEHVAADLADPDAPARLITAARTAFGHSHWSPTGTDGRALHHASSRKPLQATRFRVTCSPVHNSLGLAQRWHRRSGGF